MSKSNIKVLLVDDHAVVRYGIRSILDKFPSIQVLGEAGSLNEAYEKAEDLKPDVILLDMKLPDGDGVTGCIKLKSIIPNVKVIILTAFAEENIVYEAVKAGIDGYILKNIEGQAIVNAITDSYKGVTVIDPSISDKLVKIIQKGNESDYSLAPQDRNILELISQGCTNKEIADALFLSEKTVRNNVSKIMKKINVNNRTEAAMFWSRQKSLK
jgi:DNA-binding NarL/FixJ family response regulator